MTQRVASLMCAHRVARCLLLQVLRGALGRTLLQKAVDFNSLAHPEPKEVALRLAAEGLVQEAPGTGMGADKAGRAPDMHQAGQFKLQRRKTSCKRLFAKLSLPLRLLRKGTTQSSKGINRFIRFGTRNLSTPTALSYQPLPKLLFANKDKPFGHCDSRAMECLVLSLQFDRSVGSRF